jgi:spoIIIJ-associated protein
MKSIEVEGKTTKEAINIALQKLGVARDKVTVKILAEGHHGLFGMTGPKQAKVKITLKEDVHHTHKV